MNDHILYHLKPSSQLAQNKRPEFWPTSRIHALLQPNNSGRLEYNDELPVVPTIEVYAAR